MKTFKKVLKLLYFIALSLVFLPSLAYSAEKNSCEIPSSIADLGRDLNDNKDLENAFISTSPNKMDELFNAWNELNPHDVRLNAEFVKKVAKLPRDKQRNIGEVYKFIGATKGNRGRVDFPITKVIDGETITVRYDKFGFPDFTQFAPGAQFTYRSNSLEGTGKDMTAANNAIKAKNILGVEISGQNVIIGGTVYTWHHHQDGKTMFLVPKKIHGKTGFPHSGGAAIIRNALHGLFDSPVSINI